MQPSEFWNLRYRQIILFCKMKILAENENMKRYINLLDATTNKLIEADPLLNKKPKINPIRKVFKGLFNK